MPLGPQATYSAPMGPSISAQASTRPTAASTPSASSAGAGSAVLRNASTIARASFIVMTFTSSPGVVQRPGSRSMARPRWTSDFTVLTGRPSASASSG